MKTLINTLVLVAVLFVATVSVASACDPRTQYCPYVPTYSPPASTGGWSGAYQRAQYDVNYGYQVGQQAVQQVQYVGTKVWNSARTYPYGGNGY